MGVIARIWEVRGGSAAITLFKKRRQDGGTVLGNADKRVARALFG